MNVTQTFQLVRSGGSESDSAIRSLIAGGLPVLDRVLVELEMQPNSTLSEVVLESAYPEAVPRLALAVDSSHTVVSGAAMCALVDSGEAVGTERVLAILDDPGENPYRRARAASALGCRPSQSILGALRAVVDEQRLPVHDWEYPGLLLAAIESLVKNDDNSRSSLLLDLSVSPSYRARAGAAEAMRISVVDGMIGALEAASRDSNSEVSLAAVSALKLLGDGRCCEALLAVAGANEFDVGHNATIALGDILGISVFGREDLPEIRDEWRRCRSAMNEEVCYRSGRPIEYARLLAELLETSEYALKRQWNGELRYRTGLDARSAFLLAREREFADRFDSMDFANGALYRWGHRQDFPVS